MVAQGKKPCPFLFSVAKPKLDSQKPYPSYLHYVQGLAQVKYQVPPPPLFCCKARAGLSITISILLAFLETLLTFY
jgi:hypothetical protein